MSHKKTLAGLDIDPLTNIHVEIIDNMVKDSKSCRCALDFDSLFLDLIVKNIKITYL